MTLPSRLLLIVCLLFLLSGTFQIELTLAQSPCGETYTVLPGDTLSGIANKCGVTESAILALNPEISNISSIYIGQVLKLPDSEKAIPPEIAILPTCGDPGTLVSLLGSGFPEDSPVQISTGQKGQSSIILGNILSDQYGMVETTIRIPNSAISEKSWLVYAESLTGIPPVKGISTDFWVTGFTPDPNSATPYVVQPGDTLEGIASKYYRTVQVILAANPQINNNQVTAGQQIVIPAQPENYPSTTILPECGPAGGSIQVAGWDFPPSTMVNLKIGEYLQSNSPVGNVYVNPDETFNTSVVIPLSAEVSEDWVVSAEASGPPFIRTVSNVYSVTPPIDPNAPRIYFIRPGDTLNQIAISSQRTITAILAVNPQISNPNQLTVNDKLLIPGLDPTIIISPPSGPPFTVVEIIGGAYPANAKIEIGVSKVGADPQYVGIATTDSAGFFMSEGIIPGTAQIGERWVFYTRHARADGTLITTITSEFIITPPKPTLQPFLTIWPLSGQPGSMMHVVANNYPPLTQISLDLVSTGGAPQPILSTWSDINGSFAAEVVIPETAQDGDTWTIVAEVTSDSNITATSDPFTVVGP